MSIRRVTCPGCGAAANVPATMASVKCPACGAVWNVNSASQAASTTSAKSPAGGPAGVDIAAGSKRTEPEIALPEENDSSATAALVAVFVGAGMMLVAMTGLVVFLLNRPPDPSQVSVVEVEETIKPATPEPYREIRSP